MYETAETLQPPEGYHSSSIFRYPKSFIYIPVLLYLLTSVGFYIIWRFVRHSFFPGMEGPVLFWIVLLTWPTVDILRSLIQRIVSRLLGYNASFNVIRMTFQAETYTGDAGQFQKRDHVLWIAFAPLSIAVFLCIPLLADVQGAAGDILAFCLFVSIAKAAGDFYLVCRLLRMPRGILLYNVNSKERLVFQPTL
jgi:hypothetical protein